MKYLFVCYPKCTTCQKAKKWMDENKIEYTERNIKENNPTDAELKNWISNSGIPLNKFFNTNGLIYKSMQLKGKLLNMRDDEKIELLATDGMLVKRPLLIGDDIVMVGFHKNEWERLK